MPSRKTEGETGRSQEQCGEEAGDNISPTVDESSVASTEGD
jgi:hypothetical protein